MERKNKIISFVGKGGVGKTSMAPLTVKLIKEQKPEAKILTIDADPAVGLALALGITVKKTIDDIRQEFIDNVELEKKQLPLNLVFLVNRQPALS